MVINKIQAWQIIEEFAYDLAAELDEKLLSVIVIGSLSGGYYRPGVSDIDIIVVVADNARSATEPRVERLREEYRIRYQVPKEFGAIVVTPEQLCPPYPPEEELAPEVRRIFDQGRTVYGVQIPVIPPTRAEMLGYIQWFDRWLESKFLPENPPESLSYQSVYTLAAMACRNYIYTFSDKMIWEKKRALRTFANHHPDHSQVTIVQEQIELGGG